MAIVFGVRASLTYCTRSPFNDLLESHVAGGFTRFAPAQQPKTR